MPNIISFLLQENENLSENILPIYIKIYHNILHYEFDE